MDLFVRDIQEKEIAEPKAPSFPQVKSSTSGFPEHKKRHKPSAFRQKRQGVLPDNKTSQTPPPSTHPPLASSNHGSSTQPPGQGFMANEKANIDRENSQKLASMSPEEIEEARRELFTGLDSSILERLLKRANLDQGSNTSTFDEPVPTPEAAPSKSEQTDHAPEIRVEDTPVGTDANTAPSQNSEGLSPPDVQSNNKIRPPKPHVSFEIDQDDTPPKPEIHHPTTIIDDDSAPAEPPQEHIIDASAPELQESAHWPRAPQPADLDPSDPNFLQNLHEKYFPSLPADPSKLAWMAPVPTPNSAADRDSPYYPGQDSLPISSLRFDFRGALLPPRISRAVPVSKGLHHHGEAPEAAGYTVRELARLARSAVPGQRCVAYQTLGRILYRLGTGEFGGVHPDDVSMGIWREFSEGVVLRSLLEEAGTEEGRSRGHRSARAYATEAIWLFEKGGWKDKLKKA